MRGIGIGIPETAEASFSVTESENDSPSPDRSVWRGRAIWILNGSRGGDLVLALTRPQHLPLAISLWLNSRPIFNFLLSLQTSANMGQVEGKGSLPPNSASTRIEKSLFLRN